MQNIDGQGNLLYQFNATYDPSGHRKTLNVLLTNESFVYSYTPSFKLSDELRTLNGATTDTSYIYDGVGNRKTRTVAGVGTDTYHYNSRYELTSSDNADGGNTQYSYDINGNTLSKTLYGPGATMPSEETDYNWDLLNRLTSVSKSVNGLQTHQGTFNYGLYGWQAHSQTIDGELRNFGYGMGGELLAESIPATGIRTYVNGSIDHTLWALDPGTPVQPATFFLNDVNGSVYALTNGQGNVLERQRYDAYGNSQITDASGVNVLAASGVGNSTGYQGRSMLAEFGAVNDRFRFYDPGSGRLLSRDPLGFAAGPNVYIFCGGDPVNRTDPMGTDWVWNGTGWDWAWKDALGNIIDQEIPRSLKPNLLVGRPAAGYGHHYVPEAQVNKLVAQGRVTADAKRFLYESKDSFTGWVDGAGELDRQLAPDRYHNRRASAGTNISHEEYEGEIFVELERYITNNMPAGSAMGVTEAKDFLRLVQRGGLGNSVIRDFNKAVVAEIDSVAERVVARRAAGGGMGLGGKALTVIAVLGAAELIDQRVQAGESKTGAVIGVTSNLAVGVVTQPYHDIQQISNTGQVIIQTGDEINNAVRTAGNLDQQDVGNAFNGPAVDPANGAISIPRSPNTFRLANDLINGTGQSAVRSGTGFVRDVVQPVQYWMNRLLSP